MTSFARYQTNISEFDWLLGGGWLGGSLNYFLGEPGVGKSRFLYAAALLGSDQSMFISSDCDAAMLAKRAYNWEIFQGKTRILCEMSWEEIVSEIGWRRPGIIYVDDYRALGDPQVVHDYFMSLTLEPGRETAVVLAGQCGRRGSRAPLGAGMRIAAAHEASTILSMQVEGDGSGPAFIEAHKNRYAAIGGASLREPTMRFLRS